VDARNWVIKLPVGVAPIVRYTEFVVEAAAGGSPFDRLWRCLKNLRLARRHAGCCAIFCRF
jgi:hypothetical protein